MYKIIGADQKEYGPISSDQIRQWISEGRVNGKTQVCLEGATDWKPLELIPEFSFAATPASSGLSATALKPPGAIKVFGILNIVFGALALLCSPFSVITLPLLSKQMGYTPFFIHWLIFSSVLSFVGGGIMLASGIGLCKMRPWARNVAIYYAVYGCVMPLFNAFITLTNLPTGGANPETQRFGAIAGSVVAVVLALTYNVLLLYFLTRPEVKEALAETPQRV